MSGAFRLGWRLSRSGATPVIRQTSMADCGLACVAMIANRWGWRVDLGVLRSRAPPSMKGARMSSLLTLADEFGLEGRPVSLSVPSDLRRLRLPALLHLDGNHFAVLVRCGRNAAVLHDPARGRVSVPYETLRARVSEIAVEFQPGTRFVRREERRRLSLGFLGPQLLASSVPIAQMLLLSVLIQVCVVLAPLYVQLVVDQAISYGDAELLFVLLIGFASLAAVTTFGFLLRRIVTLKLGQSLSVGMMGSLFRHMLRLPARFYEQRHLGDVVSRFRSTTAVQEFLTGQAIDALIDSIAALVAISVLFFYGVRYALIVIAIVALEGAIHTASVGLRRLLTEDALATSAREQTLFIESVRAIRSIKLFGAEEQRYGVWQSRLTDMAGSNYRLGAADSLFRAAGDLVQAVGGIVVVYVLGRAAIGEEFTIGMMMAFIAYQVYFGRTAKNAVDALVAWRTLRVHLDRMADLALEPAENDIAGQRPEIRGDIELDAVSFSYHRDETLTIRDASLSVRSGEMLAITGASGEGKTTLLKLMLGLENAASGEIRYSGVPLESISRRHFAEAVATVMQDDVLLSGSIAQNIAFFDEDMDLERVAECARVACIDEDVERMPMRYASLIGDMGSALSGGQKQRVMIARALYRRPRVLFMDEGTSHLDLGIERRINDNLSGMSITRIVVAHRPDTLRIADRVVALELGRLVDAPRTGTGTGTDPGRERGGGATDFPPARRPA